MWIWWIRIPNTTTGNDTEPDRASINDAQATGEAFSPQKKTSSTSKHENSLFFSIFVEVLDVLF
jgi:hypothetical protein